MDILTKKGQISLEQEQKFIQRLNKKYMDRDRLFFQTPKNAPSACDGIIVNITTEEIAGIFESKCRDLTFEQLFAFGSWLVTFEKLEKCKAVSELLQVPFFGFLYLIPEDRTLLWKITDEEGKYDFDFKVRETETQATINGGKAIRNNAYLPIKFATEI